MSNSSSKFALVLALSTLALVPESASAEDGKVSVLVLKEHGVGSAATAQGYVDQLVASVAQQQGWAASEGKYVTTRAAAKTYIQSSSPHFGFLSLAAFLDLRGSTAIEVLGTAEVVGGGGRQYALISTSANSVADCKGKTLGTDHGDDARFINKVVSGDAFDLADFQVVDTKRPVKTIKAAIAGEVTCALIDDAQLAEIGSIEGGEALKSVWTSDKLPPMVVVAFPSAPAAERKAFQSGLSKVCAGAGAASCREVGLSKLAKTSEETYAAVVKAYDK